MRAFQITTQRIDTVSTKEDIDDKGRFEWMGWSSVEAFDLDDDDWQRIDTYLVLKLQSVDRA